MPETMTQMQSELDRPLWIGEVTGKGEFEGYCLLWGIPDEFDTIVERHAFDALLAEFETSGKYPPVVWEHGVDRIGECILQADEVGLRVVGQLDMETDAGRAAFRAIKSSQYYLSFWARCPREYQGTNEQGQTVYTRFTAMLDVAITKIPGQHKASLDVVRNDEQGRAAAIEAARTEAYERGLAEGRLEAQRQADEAAEAAAEQQDIELAAAIAQLDTDIKQGVADVGDGQD